MFAVFGKVSNAPLIKIDKEEGWCLKENRVNDIRIGIYKEVRRIKIDVKRGSSMQWRRNINMLGSCAQRVDQGI